MHSILLKSELYIMDCKYWEEEFDGCVKKKHSADTKNSMEILAIIIDMKNPTLGRFNSKVPDYKRSGQLWPTIFTTIRDKMREILEVHFYKKNFEPDKDLSADGKLFLRLLYGVLCDMFIKIFGEDEVEIVGKPRLRKKDAQETI